MVVDARSLRVRMVGGLVLAALVGLAGGALTLRVVSPARPGREAVLERSVGTRKLEVARFPLDRPGAYPVSAPWGQLVVEVKSGQARIALANPPCDPETHKVYNPWISQPGELDVCLPHRAVLEIREPGQ